MNFSLAIGLPHGIELSCVGFTRLGTPRELTGARSRSCVRAGSRRSDETVGQARSKAIAVEGIEAPVIDFRNDDDRSIRVGSGTLLARSEEAAK
jgi:hypothetical protein